MGAKKKGSLPRLDLHGYKTDDVFDALDHFLRKAGERGSSRAEVICGKGEGLVRKKVIEYLKLGHYHWQFTQSMAGRVNEGSLLVFLDE